MIKQAPVARPAKANSPIPKENIRMCFMAITYASPAIAERIRSVLGAEGDQVAAGVFEAVRHFCFFLNHINCALCES